MTPIECNECSGNAVHFVCSDDSTVFICDQSKCRDAHAGECKECAHVLGVNAKADRDNAAMDKAGGK